MDRRNVLGFLGAAGAIGLMQSSTSRADKAPPADSRTSRVLLYAPVEGMVIRISSISEATSVDEEVVILRSPYLDRARSRISALRGAIDILERPLNDGHVDKQLDSILSEINAAHVAEFDIAKIIRTRAQSMEREYRSPAAVATAVDIERAGRLRGAESKVKERHGRLLAADARDLVSLLRNHLDSEQEYLSRYESALSVRAGALGAFVPRVTEGAYVMRGSVLARISRQSQHVEERKHA